MQFWKKSDIASIMDANKLMGESDFMTFSTEALEPGDKYACMHKEVILATQAE